MITMHDRWAPIGLDELNAKAALQTRVDRKYVIDHETLDCLLRWLPVNSRFLTIDDRTCFRYHSLYYDLHRMSSYLDAEHGRPRRWKVRDRSYLDTGTHWLEVKTQRGEHTVKHRVESSSGERRAWMAGEQRTIDDALTDCGMPTLSLEALGPRVATDYERTTWWEPASGARLTMDQNLVWTDQITECRLRLQGLVVVETKSAGSAPSNLDHALWSLGARPRRFSKYATGLALLNPDLPHNRWHSTITHLQPHLTADHEHIENPRPLRDTHPFDELDQAQGLVPRRVLS